MSRFSLRNTGGKIGDLGGNQSDTVSIRDFLNPDSLGYRLPEEGDVTREELRDGFSPGFDIVNESAEVNQVRRDIEQKRKDVVEIKKVPGMVRQ
jgi:hypothetical protein